MKTVFLPPTLLNGLERALHLILLAIGASMVLLVFTNVVTHLFHKDIAWTTELCEFFMVWVTFLGGAVAARRGAHMTITEFLDKLGEEKRRWADAAIQLLCLVVLLMLLYYGAIIVNANWENRLTVLGWPMAFQYLALPVGASLSLIFVGHDFMAIMAGQDHQQRYGE
jgi:TRAP-type C4-dicarboxylate transport system permease small subunit